MRKFFPTIKRWKKVIIGIAAAYAVLFVTYAFPAENIFITFSSPEEAYKYKTFGTPLLSVDGEYSSMVCGYSNGSESPSFIPKTENGWKTRGLFPRVETRAFRFDSVFGAVYRYGDTSDRYIMISLPFNKEKTEVSDSLDSEFYCYTYQADGMDGAVYYQCVYCALVGGADGDYILTVGGKSYRLCEYTDIP